MKDRDEIEDRDDEDEELDGEHEVEETTERTGRSGTMTFLAGMVLGAERISGGTWNAPSEHHLRPQQHFVELIVTGCRIGVTELRPSVNVVEHQLEIVAFDVIVQPADDGVHFVIACLARIETFVFPDELKLPARKIISASAIPSAPGPDRSSAPGWSFMF